jgi:hypothetical protein
MHVFLSSAVDTRVTASYESYLSLLPEGLIARWMRRNKWQNLFVNEYE